MKRLLRNLIESLRVFDILIRAHLLEILHDKHKQHRQYRKRINTASNPSPVRPRLWWRAWAGTHCSLSPCQNAESCVENVKTNFDVCKKRMAGNENRTKENGEKSEIRIHLVENSIKNKHSKHSIWCWKVDVVLWRSSWRWKPRLSIPFYGVLLFAFNVKLQYLLMMIMLMTTMSYANTTNAMMSTTLVVVFFSHSSWKIVVQFFFLLQKMLHIIFVTFCSRDQPTLNVKFGREMMCDGTCGWQSCDRRLHRLTSWNMYSNY